jgi:hypothetical protein
MAQRIKNPTGWVNTTGSWVKTSPTEWSAVDSVYTKTPTGWIKASGQMPAQVIATRPAVGTRP